MRSKNRKTHALRQLKPGTPLVNVRRALDALFDIPHEEMANALHVSRPNISSHIAGIRHNTEIQRGIAALWGGIPVDEIF